MFILSSSTATGERWFEMSKMRRFAQTTASARDMRHSVRQRLGDGFVVRTLPEREPKVAKRVVGMAKVVKSFAVKR